MKVVYVFPLWVSVGDSFVLLRVFGVLLYLSFIDDNVCICGYSK